MQNAVLQYLYNTRRNVFLKEKMKKESVVKSHLNRKTFHE